MRKSTANSCSLSIMIKNPYEVICARALSLPNKIKLFFGPNPALTSSDRLQRTNEDQLRDRRPQNRSTCSKRANRKHLCKNCAKARPGMVVGWQYVFLLRGIFWRWPRAQRYRWTRAETSGRAADRWPGATRS